MSDAIRITDLCLLVADMDRSVAFYRDRMGLAVKRLDAGFAEFHTGDATLALWLRDDIAGNLDSPRLREGGCGVMAAVRLPDRDAVDREAARLKAAGVALSHPAQEWPWNAYAAYFPDPDGHLWELYCWMGAPRTL